jgi:colanic acid biosynthesis glycosyl transferase WcaI
MLDTLLIKGSKDSQNGFLPNWIDTNKIFPKNSEGNTYRQEWKISSNTCVALYSGNIGEKQGLEIIVSAAEKLQCIHNILFVICGSGSALHRLQNMAKGLSNIKWIPLQQEDDMNDLLNSADIHLLPQLNSVSDLLLPSKLSGIFASGRPVIVTADFGSSLFNATIGCGLAVPTGSLDKFSQAIVRLAYDPEYRRLLGLNGRKVAIDSMEKNKILEKLEVDLICLIEDTKLC